MCICVDCHWVDRCRAYHAVEARHGQPHLTPTPSFEPREPRIHISLVPVGETWGSEWDVRACGSFRPDPGRWRRLRPAEPLPR